MDYSARGRYDVILGIDIILTALGLNINFSEHVIKWDDITLKLSTAPMIDMTWSSLRRLLFIHVISFE